MIARIWRCTVSVERLLEYLEHFQQSVYVDVKKLKGFKKVKILQRDMDGAVELTVISFWESLDAIRSFAGENVETAVVAPAAQAILLTFETTVTHHKVALNLE
jgi:heme-degrading monooxygenase HmoA